MSLQDRRARPYGKALLWGIAIFLSSSSVITVRQLGAAVEWFTSGRLAAKDFTKVWIIVWWFFVKGWHAVEFGLLTLFLSRFMNRQRTAMAALGFALTDEFHQYFVPSRGARLSDVAIDAIGIALWSLWTPSVKKWQKVTALVLAVGLIFLFALHPFGTFGAAGV